MAVIRIVLPQKKPAQPAPPAGAPHPAPPHPRPASALPKPPPGAKRHYEVGKKPTYARVFRWQPPAGHPAQPASVEIVGSFTAWQKVSLEHVAATNTWQVTVPDIPSNRTHHYMMLVDGQPVSDKNCDGLAVPDGPQEAQFQLSTPRGPRVLMLFAHTK